jgi:REP element-mobilizing transposase RayT
MADYRRCYVPGGSYFFTVVTERRAGILANDTARNCLREAIRDCRLTLPFAVDALVMLPDHIHAIWTLPPGDGDFSKRWGIVKKHFTQHWLALGGTEQNLTASRLRYRRRGVWAAKVLGSSAARRTRLSKPLRLPALQSRQTWFGQKRRRLAVFVVSPLGRARRLSGQLGSGNGWFKF